MVSNYNMDYWVVRVCVHGDAMRFIKFVRNVMLAAMLTTSSMSGYAVQSQTPSSTPISKACDGSSCSYSALIKEVIAAGGGIQAFNALVSSLQSMGFTFTAQGPGGPNRFALGGQGETGKAGAAGPAPWNGYVAAARANIGSSFQPTQAGGSVDVGIVGVDYTFANKAILGAAVSGARARVETPFNGGNVSANTTSISPYLLFPISQALQLDATAGFGRSSTTTQDNSVAGGISGSNNGTSSSYGLGLTYRHQTGKWGFNGRGALSTAENKQDSVTLSNNTFVNASTTRTSTLRLGGQAAYNAGTFVPFAGLTYIYDFQKATQSAVLGQNPANDKDGFQLVAGMQFRSQGALYGGFQLSSELGRKEVKNNSLVFNLGIRF